VLRYEPDSAIITVGNWNTEGPVIAERAWPEEGTVSELVARTGTPGRIDSDAGSGGLISQATRPGGVSAVGCPIMVGGRLWGAVIASSSTLEPLSEGIEARMQDFTELVAIANTQSHAELAASRARLVTAADQIRRRVERDLQNGLQQDLVTLALDLGVIQEQVPPELKGHVSQTVATLQRVSNRVRAISRGLYPAFLARSGLQPALKTLARHSPVPVELTINAYRRIPERVELAAYHVVAEALANTAKHAHASVAHVDVTVKETVIRLSVRDDGTGGATQARGSGLLGLTDRAEALGGRIEIDSPPGGGTSILVETPINDG
jgi:signal transduction histidine kinase